MDLLPDEAQQEVIASTAALLAKELPVSRLRNSFRAGPERLADTLWRTFAELGWFGLGLADDLGGVGFSAVEEVLLARELGRALAPPSVIATLLAARCAALASDGQRRGALLGGTLRAGWAEPLGDVEIGSRVRGRFQLIDADGTQLLFAANASGAALLDVAAARGEAKACLDDAVAIAEASIDAPALAFVPAAREPLALRAVLLTAAALTGIAEGARDQAARYANERVQFGKPIGAFQAIKHRCADMAVRAEVAWQQTAYAALALRGSLSDAAFQVASAKALAAQAALESSASNVQVHGGYGFTVEYDAQLLVKRAHVYERLAGSRTQQLAAVLAAPPPL
jgi:alkylation response protein AidB-like acyl-CoA dehydrogenase